MRRLKPTVDEPTARRLLAGRWWMRLLGRLSLVRKHVEARRTGADLRIERIGLPYYRVHLVAHGADGPGELACLVSADDGELVRLGSLGPTWEDGPPGPPALQFAPRLGPDDARTVAEQAFLVARFRRVAPSVGPALAASIVELVEYPLWVAYVRRRAGWDIRVLDAVTGRPAGPRLRSVVLGALVRRHEEMGL